MLKTNRENPGGGIKFNGNRGARFSPVDDNSSYGSSSPTEAISKFSAGGADPDTASLMGSIYDSGGPLSPERAASGLSQIKHADNPEGITATPPVLNAPPVPASGLSAISGGSGGGVSGSMGTYGNGQMINGIPQFSVGYMSGAPAPGAGTKVRL